MKIIRCILDIKNTRSLFGVTIAKRIERQGQLHLWNERPPGMAIDTIVVHYISADETYPRAPFSLPAILKIFCDRGVSVHYLIDRGGTVFALVPEYARGWHAGGSIMPAPDNRRNVNNFSIGIELIATPRCLITDAQYTAAAELCHDIQQRYKQPMVLVGHDDIAGARAVTLGLRPDLKKDPGRFFDWRRFKREIAGLSLFPLGGN